MGLDFAQIKATKEGLDSGGDGYRAYWISEISNLYEKILKVNFPIKRIIADDYYDNCIDRYYSKKEDIDKYYNEYLEDLKNFPMKDFKKFNNITVQDLKDYLNGIDPDEDIVYEFIEDDIIEDEYIQNKLNDYKEVFNDILKLVEDGFIYYYIIQ